MQATTREPRIKPGGGDAADPTDRPAPGQPGTLSQQLALAYAGRPKRVSVLVRLDRLETEVARQQQLIDLLTAGQWEHVPAAGGTH